MVKKFLIPLMLLCGAVSMTGCAVVVAGAGAGAGVYSYVVGELKRTYEVDSKQALAATFDAMESLKIKVERQKADGIQTRILGKRTDGTPVTIKVTLLSPKMTEIGVRSGVVGFWDKKVSELIHATIAQKF